MDGLVTYVDLAEKANRYSFQLIGVHTGGEAEEVKQEERVEKEEVVEKGDKAQSIHFPHLLQWIYLFAATGKEPTEWGLYFEKRSEMLR